MWQDLIKQAMGGYVEIEKAKASAGMAATTGQQAAIQSPTRTQDAQAKAESMTAGIKANPWIVPVAIGAAALIAYVVLK